MGRYLNHRDQVVRLQHLLESPPADHPERPKHSPTKRARRLNDDQAAHLLARYQAGETVYQLAAAFKINRNTVSTILKRQNVTPRWRRLTDDDVGYVIELYNAGRSMASVAAQFEVNPSTIYQVLKRRGVTRRPNGTNQWT